MRVTLNRAEAQLLKSRLISTIVRRANQLLKNSSDTQSGLIHVEHKIVWKSTDSGLVIVLFICSNMLLIQMYARFTHSVVYLHSNVVLEQNIYQIELSADDRILNDLNLGEKLAACAFGSADQFWVNATFFFVNGG